MAMCFFAFISTLSYISESEITFNAAITTICHLLCCKCTYSRKLYSVKYLFRFLDMDNGWYVLKVDGVAICDDMKIACSYIYQM